MPAVCGVFSPPAHHGRNPILKNALPLCRRSFFFNCHRHSKFRDISNNCEDHLSQAIPQTRSNCKFATDVSDVIGTMCTEDHASQAIPRNRFQSKNAGCLRAVPRPAPIESLQRKPVIGTMCTEGHALQAIPRTRVQNKYAGCLWTCPQDKYATYDRKLQICNGCQ